jgi:hypothetical protein
MVVDYKNRIYYTDERGLTQWGICLNAVRDFPT